MTVEENKRLIRHLHEEVMNRHDPDAYAAFFAPDATNHGRPVGRAGIRRVLAEIFRTFPDWHNTVDEVIAEGDTVVIRNTTTATHLGTPTMARPPSRSTTSPASPRAAGR